MNQTRLPRPVPILILIAALAAILSPPRALAEEPAPPVVSFEEALDMMDRCPATEKGTKPFAWSKVGGAKPIARAISRRARTRLEAGYLVVYGEAESALRPDAAGDKDKDGAAHSFGYLQISDKRMAAADAMDPDKATVVWLRMADDARLACAHLPEDEQLSQVASGNCGAGRLLAARRARLARAISEPQPTAQLP